VLLDAQERHRDTLDETELAELGEPLEQAIRDGQESQELLELLEHLAIFIMVMELRDNPESVEQMD